MSRKRRLDLRDFWPWYERSWHVKGGRHAQPPPFTLQDIHSGDEPPTSGLKWFQAFFVLVAIVVAGLAMWMIFH